MHIGVMSHMQVASFRMMTLLLNLNAELWCIILSAILNSLLCCCYWPSHWNGLYTIGGLCSEHCVDWPCWIHFRNSKVSVQYIMQINLQMQDLDPGSNYARKELWGVCAFQIRSSFNFISLFPEGSQQLVGWPHRCSRAHPPNQIPYI